jgi:hypothetical protein
MRQIKWLLLVIVLACGAPCASQPSPGGRLIAASGAAEHIQKAVENAKPGDTIVIPEGQFRFRGQVLVSDGVSIRGAGKDKTVLIKDDRLGIWQPMFDVDCKTGMPFSFSGITLQGKGRESQDIEDQGLVLRGKCRNFRIFGNRFTKFSRAGIELVGDDGSVHGETKGVIFENDFIDNWYSNLGYGIAVNGHPDAWRGSAALGTDEAVFVEDNNFISNRCAIQANNGARYVFRHNKISNNREDSAAIYAHGKTEWWPRGTRSFEIYGNTVKNDETRWAGIVVSGGNGVIFDNDLEGVSHGIVLMIDAEFDPRIRYPYQDQISDTWLWQNAANGYPIDRVTLSGEVDVTKFLREGRDFFMRRKPGYQPFAYPHPAR